MAQKIIKGPVDDNSLNSTNHNFTELYSGFRDTNGKINKVEKDINDRMDNFIDETSDAAFDKVVDSARLNWDRMVEKYSDLPSDAETGKTIGVKEDSKVYRYNGTDWDDIYEINLNPISEVDDRLSSQLAETTEHDLNILLIPDVHYSSVVYGGLSPDDRVQFLIDCINEEHDKKPLDMVFFMGDLSSNNPPESTEKLITEHLHKLKMPYFALNGNHDLITDENWIKLLGYEKNYSFSFGGYAFIVLDTFANPVDENETYYGQQYSKVDISYFDSEVEKYKDKKIFVLCHQLNYTLDPELTNLIYETPNIEAVFQGHLHDDSVTLINGDGIPLITTGHFCYPRNENTGIEKAWGYRTLRVKNGEVITEKVLVERNYPDFSQDYEVKDKIVLFEANKSMLSIKDSEHLMLKNIFSKVNPLYDKTSNQLINTSGIVQHKDGGIISVFFNDDMHIDDLHHTGMYYVSKNSNGSPFDGYLIVTGYSVNNFVQILLEQTSLRIPRMIMRTQSGGSEISNWYEQGSRHLPGGAEEMEGFTRHNVICAVSGGIVNISGHVGGTFGTVFSTSRVLKLVDSITPTGIHYGVCTFTTSGNIPTGVAVARVNGDGYVEIIGESEHEGNAHFNIQYQLSK